MGSRRVLLEVGGGLSMETAEGKTSPQCVQEDICMFAYFFVLEKETEGEKGKPYNWALL